jgi:hypothetical protein
MHLELEAVARWQIREPRGKLVIVLFRGLAEKERLGYDMKGSLDPA